MTRITWTPELVLGMIRARAAELNDTPTRWEMGVPLYEAARRFFGSGTAAIMAAELPPNPKHTNVRRGFMHRAKAAISKPKVVRDPAVSKERKAYDRRMKHDHTNDWRRGAFRTLGIGPRLEIVQPGPDSHLAFAAPDDLIHSKRAAA